MSQESGNIVRTKSRQNFIRISLEEACRNAKSASSGITIPVAIDNRRFWISKSPIYIGSSFFAFVRLGGLLIFAECCDSRGEQWIEAIMPTSAFIPNVDRIDVAGFVSQIDILRDQKPKSQSSKRMKEIASRLRSI